MYYIISYDIANNKRRFEVSKILEEYGLRTQLSVFECELDKSLLQKLLVSLSNSIDKHEDSLLCYSLCKSCERHTLTFGTAFSIYNTSWKII